MNLVCFDKHELACHPLVALTSMTAMLSAQRTKALITWYVVCCMSVCLSVCVCVLVCVCGYIVYVCAHRSGRDDSL